MINELYNNEFVICRCDLSGANRMCVLINMKSEGNGTYCIIIISATINIKHSCVWCTVYKKQ